MQVASQKETKTHYGYPPIAERKHPFNNLKEMPFKVFVIGSVFEGTVMLVGEVLSNGMPSAFQVSMPGKRMVTIT